MADIRYYDVILKPVVTEKSMDIMADKKYTFLVHPEANKAMIKEAVEIQKKNSAKWLRKPRSTFLTATSSNVLFQEDLRRITKIPSSMHTEC